MENRIGRYREMDGSTWALAWQISRCETVPMGTVNEPTGCQAAMRIVMVGPPPGVTLAALWLFEGTSGVLLNTIDWGSNL